MDKGLPTGYYRRIRESYRKGTFKGVITQTFSKRDSEEKKKAKIKLLYQVFGVSKQAFYKRQKALQRQQFINDKVIEIVQNIRKRQRKMGTRKLYDKIKDELLKNNIKMGRDALFTLLRNHGMLIKKNKCYHITTNSKHFYYTSPNLLKETELIHAEQAVVCDITYIKTDQGHAYLSLVTDPYSKQIMGYALEDNMKVDMVKKALKMAHKNMKFGLENIIHHSDRGIQYCCPDYTEFAEKLGFKMSTTQKYDPYENAVAERINGILKYEFGFKNVIKDIKTAQKMIKEAVEIYNHERSHWGLDLKTPAQAHNDFNKHIYKSYSKKIA